MIISSQHFKKILPGNLIPLLKKTLINPKLKSIQGFKHCKFFVLSTNKTHASAQCIETSSFHMKCVESGTIIYMVHQKSAYQGVKN